MAVMRDTCTIFMAIFWLICDLVILHQIKSCDTYHRFSAKYHRNVVLIMFVFVSLSTMT